MSKWLSWNTFTKLFIDFSLWVLFYGQSLLGIHCWQRPLHYGHRIHVPCILLCQSGQSKGCDFNDCRGIWANSKRCLVKGDENFGAEMNLNKLRDYILRTCAEYFYLSILFGNLPTQGLNKSTEKFLYTSIRCKKGVKKFLTHHQSIFRRIFAIFYVHLPLKSRISFNKHKRYQEMESNCNFRGAFRD